MPAPNPSVLFALFESYLTMRKPTWKLVVNEDKLIIPDFKPEDDAHIKLNICVDILRKASAAQAVSEWIELLTQLYTYEKDETERFNKRYRLHQWIGSNEIAILLQATREYIINQIKEDTLFIKYRSALVSKQIKLAQKHDTLTSHPEDDYDQSIITDAAERLSAVRMKKQAIQETDNKLNEFFVTCISKHNAKPLGEAVIDNDIKDFIRNAEKGLRPAKLCTMLMNELNKAFNPNITVAPQKDQPAPVALATILDDDPAILFAGKIIDEDPFASPEKTKTSEPVRKQSGARETAATSLHSLFGDDSPEQKSSAKNLTRRRPAKKASEGNRPRLSDQDSFPPLSKATQEANPRTQQNVYYTRSKSKK